MPTWKPIPTPMTALPRVMPRAMPTTVPSASPIRTRVSLTLVPVAEPRLGVVSLL